MRQANNEDIKIASQFVPLRSIGALGELFERSNDEPVVLKQHDPYCRISRTAYRELEDARVQAALVDVAHDQALSRTIEERTGIRHESPQVVVFHSGKVVWNASHFKIRRRAVIRAVERAASGERVEECELVCRATLMRTRDESLNALMRLRVLWDRQ